MPQARRQAANGRSTIFPELVLVDLGQTIVDERDPDLRKHIRSVSARADGAAAVSAISSILPILRAEADRDDLTQRPSEELIASALRDEHPDLTIEQFYECVWQLLGAGETDYLAPLPGALEFLAEAQRRKTPVVAVSNTALPPRVVHRLLKRHGIAPLLVGEVYSSAVGSKKPAPEMFLHALSVAGLNGEQFDRIVMIGNDYRADIEPAIIAGAVAIWVGATDAATSVATSGRLRAVADIGTAWTAIDGSAHA